MTTAGPLGMAAALLLTHARCRAGPLSKASSSSCSSCSSCSFSSPSSSCPSHQPNWLSAALSSVAAWKSYDKGFPLTQQGSSQLNLQHASQRYPSKQRQGKHVSQTCFSNKSNQPNFWSGIGPVQEDQKMLSSFFVGVGLGALTTTTTTTVVVVIAATTAAA
jgi:hypothetical protein